MGTQRTSNKDIAEKLDTLISILTSQAAQVQTPAVNAEPDTVVKAGPLPMAHERKAPASETTTPEVDQKYMAHMTAKVQGLYDTDGQARVIYLRRNLNGEVKIAYCLKDRWLNLRDNGLIGAAKVIG